MLFHNAATFTENPFHHRYQQKMLLAITHYLIEHPDLFHRLINYQRSLPNNPAALNQQLEKETDLMEFLGKINDLEQNNLNVPGSKPGIDSIDKVLFYWYFFKELSAGLRYNPYKASAIEDKKTRQNLYDIIKKHIYLFQCQVYSVKCQGQIKEYGLNLPEFNLDFSSKYLARLFSGKMQQTLVQEYEAAQADHGNVVEKSLPCIIYLVTMGNGFDTTIEDLTHQEEIYESYMLNAVGGAITEFMVEDLMQFFNDKLTLEWNDNCSFSSAKIIFRRASPGYGDWNITDQKKIFQILSQAHIDIPVQLTSSYLMLPEKSTTGIMGLKQIKNG